MHLTLVSEVQVAGKQREKRDASSSARAKHGKHAQLRLFFGLRHGEHGANAARAFFSTETTTQSRCADFFNRISLQQGQRVLRIKNEERIWSAEKLRLFLRRYNSRKSENAAHLFLCLLEPCGCFSKFSCSVKKEE